MELHKEDIWIWINGVTQRGYLDMDQWSCTKRISGHGSMVLHKEDIWILINGVTQRGYLDMDQWSYTKRIFEFLKFTTIFNGELMENKCKNL